jgi:hypothetical protein
LARERPLIRNSSRHQRLVNDLAARRRIGIAFALQSAESKRSRAQFNGTWRSTPMFVINSPTGIIATPQPDLTSPLEDLVDCCGWPLVLAATARRLQRDLSIHNPQCVLFWIEDRRYLTPTKKLIAWLHERGNRPYRMVVAHRQDQEVELVLRAAGAHGYVAVLNDVASAVGESLAYWLKLPAASSCAGRKPGAESATVGRAARVSNSPDTQRPP